ncbi:MAG TPA: hypothetical protein VJR89_42445 [Polyangiales bacterium]|nr:hypothetical protein [Polyangiales bacterium]
MQPSIRRIREVDWAIARALRLRSLLDAPHAARAVLEPAAPALEMRRKLVRS